MCADVKIFSTMPNDSDFDYVENEVYVPVCGGAIFNKASSKMQGDNTGDHISQKNRMYCELTTQYWAWKNVDADYYGFGHYRRYFSFSDQKYPADDWGFIIKDYLDDDLMDLMCTDPDHIRDVVSQYDALAPTPVDLTRVQIESVHAQYKSGVQLRIKDLDLMLDIIQEFYPEYYEAANSFLKGTTIYLCNMFIMRRDLFQTYNEFLFGVLEKFEQQADMSIYSKEGLRTPGHLGERLFGIFFTYLSGKNKYRLGHLQPIVIGQPKKEKEILPAFQSDSVNIVFSSSEYFAPYCAAAIQSVLAHRKLNRDYDIVILEQEMSDTTKNRMKQFELQFPGVSIRTINVRRWFYKYKLHMNEHFSVETYFRLVIPELLHNYDRILYLDGDIIAKTDVGELFDTNIENYVAAAVLDVVGMGIVNGFDKDRVQYCKQQLLMKDFLYQMNGGVLLMNAAAIRTQYTAKELLRYAELGQFILHDQDVFNSLFEGQIKWVDCAWNAAIDPKSSLRSYVATFAPGKYYAEYLEAVEHPKILHFAGTIKPWNEPGYLYAEEFWQALRPTPFYELTMHRRIVENAQFFSSEATSHLSAAKTKSNGNSGKSIWRRMADSIMPKGTMRREYVKKFAFRLIGKPYVTPYYMLGRD